MPYSFDNIHPLIIHFPIALTSMGFVFDIFGSILNREDLKNAGFWCMLSGILSCLFAIISGLKMFLNNASLSYLLEFNHFIITCLSTIIFIILFWLRIKLDVDFIYSKIKQQIYFCIYFLAILLLFYGSHLGAKAAGRI